MDICRIEFVNGYLYIELFKKFEHLQWLNFVFYIFFFFFFFFLSLKPKKKRFTKPVHVFASCDACDRSFKNQEKYNEHLAQHKKVIEEWDILSLILNFYVL